MSDTRKLLHQLEMDVRWGDMDAAGHVNNIMYFQYFEQARVGWLMTLAPIFKDRSLGLVIVNASCTFLRPLRFPERIEVCLYAGSPGRTSFETSYEIRSTSDRQTLYAEGQAKAVWIDRSKGSSVEIPEAVRNLLTES